MIRILRHTAKFNNNAFTTEIGSIVMRARHAQQQWAGASDELVDRVFQRVALEASTHRIDLAQHALHETGRGVLEDKVIKNLFAVENVFNSFKTWRAPTTTTTTTTTTYNNDSTIMSFTPFGVIAALCPVTNPTSTAMYKALLAIRTRNAVVVCPHPSARQCTIRAVRVIANAATKAGAPQDLVSVLDDVSKSNVQQIMANSDLIWATGGADMVESAQKIGVPALLGGPGNCAALIDELCNVDDAVASVLLSKSFDHGMICAAEQTIVVVDAVYDRVRSALQTQGAVVLSQSDARKLGAAMHADGNYMNKAMVGKSPLFIAHIAGLTDATVTDSTRALIGEADSTTIGIDDAWSCEKMAPVLGMYRAKSFDEGVEIAAQLVRNGGVGHVAALHTSPSWRHWQGKANDRVLRFQNRVPAGEVLVNQPSSYGVIGDVFNFNSTPRLSVQTRRAPGTPVEIEPRSLLKVVEVARRQSHFLWVRLPSAILFDEGSARCAIDMAIRRAPPRQSSNGIDEDACTLRAMIVADKNMEHLGLVDEYERAIHASALPRTVRVARFVDVEPDPSYATVLKGLQRMRDFDPSFVVAVGGGSVLDAAKMMRLLLDHPDVEDLDALEARFMDITKRVSHLPQRHDHQTQRICVQDTLFVAIPTTSGTGSEVSPFAVITDPRNGRKYPLADYCMTPDITAVDYSLVATLPPSMIAAPGFDAISHAIESHVSVLASNFTRPWSERALVLLFEHLPRSLNGDLHSRRLCHEAATLAGMALSNAFVGVAHSIAHQLGARFHLAHGVCCTIALPHIIRYNAVVNPTKHAAFPQHSSPHKTIKQYVALADALHLKAGDTDKAKIDALCDALIALARQLGLPTSIRDAAPHLTQQQFEDIVEQMALDAFDDQCTISNPRYPLVTEIATLIRSMF